MKINNKSYRANAQSAAENQKFSASSPLSKDGAKILKPMAGKGKLLANKNWCNIEITIQEKLWEAENKRIKSDIKTIIKKILPETKLAKYIDKNKLEISILLVGDKKMKELSHIYRGKNKATNVLSFPTNDTDKIKNGNLKSILIVHNFLPIGDIVLSFQTIKKESAEQNKTFQNHLTHLLIHSILHLIGYDHIDKQDATIMENLEIELLKKLDIDDPYIIIRPF